VNLSIPVAASPDAWAELDRPSVLAASLPGCRSAEPADGGGLRLVVDVAVASVRGLWAGTLTPADGDGGGWRVVGSGEPGHVDLALRVDPDHTTVTVEGTVEGPLAAIGSNLLAAAVRRLVQETLARAER
jgi:carbon monoxide dehydrogenase subunit G